MHQQRGSDVVCGTGKAGNKDVGREDAAGTENKAGGMSAVAAAGDKGTEGVAQGVWGVAVQSEEVGCLHLEGTAGKVSAIPMASWSAVLLSEGTAGVLSNEGKDLPQEPAMVLVKHLSELQILLPYSWCQQNLFHSDPLKVPDLHFAELPSSAIG